MIEEEEISNECEISSGNFGKAFLAIRNDCLVVIKKSGQQVLWRDCDHTLEPGSVPRGDRNDGGGSGGARGDVDVCCAEWIPRATMRPPSRTK